ncbi:MAG: hypothetical protein PUC68_03595 [Firmicutes bacterium]|nr:hypothetical protein [Bacillota bacterium]
MNKLRNLLFVVLTLLVLTGSSLAWFTLTDTGRVSTMSLEITGGSELRFDIEEHDNFNDYLKTIPMNRLIDNEISLEPVTTYDGVNYVYEDGSPSEAYYKIDLYFISSKDMDVYLDKETILNSETPGLISSIRLSFESEDIITYDPDMSYSEEYLTDKLFSLEANVSKKVIMRIWFEGTDPECTNDLKGKTFSIKFKFTGSE